MSGFIVMSRDALDHPVLRDPERFRAWFWLIANACWKPTRVRIKGEIVTLERGDLSFSQRFLAEKWGWSKSRVDRFIADLRDQGMIETRSKNGATTDHKAGQGQTILTICNYDKYQGEPEGARGNSGATCGATAGQQRGNSGAKKNKGTREQEYLEEADASPKYIPPEPTPAPEQSQPKPQPALADFPQLDCADAALWADFLRNRKAKRLPNTATAHAKLVADLAQMAARTGWPPGEVFAACVAKGWGAIYDPRSRHDERGYTHLRGSGQPGSGDRRSNLAKAIDEAERFLGS